MSKRRLVELSMFDKVFDLYLRAKDRNTEQDFIKNMKKRDPQLGAMYQKWDNSINTSLRQMKHTLGKQGIDTKDIQKVLKKKY
jgi:hypothetical protein